MSYNSLDGNLPEKIANFSYLETLKLGDNKITGSIPDGIFNMSSLIEIILRYNNISGKLPYNICSNTPKLRIMSLSGTQLNGEIPANIYKCRGLEDLRLPKNHFSGDIPREIWSLSMLRVLSLFTNQFTELQQFCGAMWLSQQYGCLASPRRSRNMCKSKGYASMDITAVLFHCAEANME
ncbi:hypothetical protein ACS0TY_027836 [Phlomoides rotata]